MIDTEKKFKIYGILIKNQLFFSGDGGRVVLGIFAFVILVRFCLMSTRERALIFDNRKTLTSMAQSLPSIILERFK